MKMNPYSLPFYPSCASSPSLLSFLRLPQPAGLAQASLPPFFYSIPSLGPPGVVPYFAQLEHCQLVHPSWWPATTDGGNMGHMCCSLPFSYHPCGIADGVGNPVGGAFPSTTNLEPKLSSTVQVFPQRRKSEGVNLNAGRVCPKKDTKSIQATTDFNGGAKKWQGRRRCLRKKPITANASPEDFFFKTGGEGGGRTSVMIKNIPNKYTKAKLLALVDSHCTSENQKVRRDSDEKNPIFSEFDFFYLPMDFSTGFNLGYAFVNFTTPVAAWRFHAYFHSKPWGILNSRKICEVTFARIQGLEALKMNFENSSFACNSDDLLPVEFDPPRNGTDFNVKHRFIGRRRVIS